MRTTKKERQENARKIYYALMHSSYRKIAVLVNRENSSNPNVQRCQFLAVNPLSGDDKPVIFAESNFGMSGCFIEFISSYYNEVQRIILKIISMSGCLKRFISELVIMTDIF